MSKTNQRGHIVLSGEEMKPFLESPEYINGLAHFECIVEPQSSGTLCWNAKDTNEPTHQVNRGDRLWCMNFRATDDGYTHDYGSIGSDGVSIVTNVELKLVYITNNQEDKELYRCDVSKSPKWV